MTIKLLIFATALVFATVAGPARADPPTWTVILHPDDIIAGPNLQKLNTRHHWKGAFGEPDGTFEIAVRKAVFPAAAPQCRMDYLILSMPSYYPENPKRASVPERRAVYESLLAMQETKKGRMHVHVDALYFSRKGPHGHELTSCNIYFFLPLERDAGTLFGD